MYRLGHVQRLRPMKPESQASDDSDELERSGRYSLNPS